MLQLKWFQIVWLVNQLGLQSAIILIIRFKMVNAFVHLKTIHIAHWLRLFSWLLLFIPLRNITVTNSSEFYVVRGVILLVITLIIVRILLRARTWARVNSCLPIGTDFFFYFLTFVHYFQIFDFTQLVSEVHLLNVDSWLIRLFAWFFNISDRQTSINRSKSAIRLKLNHFRWYFICRMRNKWLF